MTADKRVLIAGAGPVGLVAAAALARRNVPVTVLEALASLSEESRASTFHPSTLDFLDELGFAGDLIAQGLRAPGLQYRSRRDGVLARFDFGLIHDITRHPYRLQAEQFKLTRIIHAKLSGDPNYQIEFDQRVCGVTQHADEVTVRVQSPDGAVAERSGRWLIAADGARSEVRSALAMEFEGFTWPERFLVVSTPFDFYSIIPELDPVTYVADPQQWHFLLRIPGAWRLMFPIAPEISDAAALTGPFAQARLATVVPGRSNYEISHTTLYRVHQRVAKSFRKGRVFLAGDAAHINNPLGGMGMNGGIHDALNLTERLARVWHGEAAEADLDRYDAQRRGITLEYVQTHSVANKRNLEAREPAEQDRFRDEMRALASDPRRAHAYLERVSMIASLKRAAELG
jgi:3-(3-hydroxy-phenyl)propionate hydroxylase